MRDFDFPGRSAVHAQNGMVATSHPLATGAALDVLKAGGNAVDAAITAAATLAVVEPQSTGIGGDCFCLLKFPNEDKVIGFNGSGRSPKNIALEPFLERGLRELEDGDVHTVTLPGAIDAWTRLHKDHGRFELGRLLAPAIGYARDGYPIHGRVRFDWLEAEPKLRRDPPTRALFLPNDRVPREGDIHRQPRLGATLQAIAAGGRDAFYAGEIAEAMVKTLQSRGGHHSLEDFASVEGHYVDPVTTRYRGVDVHQIPPNNQGITALLMLNILSGFDLPGLGPPLSAARTHHEIEAGRLAYAIRDGYLADAGSMTVSTDELLSEHLAGELRRRIDPDRALEDVPRVKLPKSDTVYLSVVDGDGLAVSFINSLFHSFGSGILCPTSGVLFQNRGQAFSLDPAHPNCLGPAKRSLHTIMPGLATRNGRAEMSFGVMGAAYQPFGQVRLLTNVYDYGLDVQAALDMARVFASGDFVEVEKSLPAETLAGLLERGHQLVLAPEPLGGGQAIFIDHARGLLTGGSDPRKDGCALGY